MNPAAYFKALFIASLGLLTNMAHIPSVEGGRGFVASMQSALYHAVAYEVTVVNPSVELSQEKNTQPIRIILTAPSNTATATPVVQKSDAIKSKKTSPAPGAPSKPTTSTKPSETPKPVSTALPSPNPTPKPSSSPTPPIATSVPSPTPLPSPDFEVGTLLIGGNPAQVRTGETVHFSVFVRDANDTAVKNKQMTFAISGKASPAATDADGYAFLTFPTTAGFVGTLHITVQLGQKQATFSVEVKDIKPDLDLSSFAFTAEGYHVRLRNAAADYVANWQVSAYRRDGVLIATAYTNELGVIEFPLPPREEGGHLYACAEVKDIGRKCTEW